MVSTNVSQTAHDKIAVIGKKARAASLIMAKASSKQKNNVLLTLTDLLGKNLEDLLKANNLDIVEAEKNGLSKAFIDRLTISVDTVAQMAAGLRQIASLRDPIGEITDVRPQPSGIEVGKMRVPLGVVAIIYESRPNVTIDAAALCLKSGNAAVLRGGSDAKHSNAFLAGLIQQALSENSITSDHHGPGPRFGRRIDYRPRIHRCVDSPRRQGLDLPLDAGSNRSDDQASRWHLPYLRG